MRRLYTGGGGFTQLQTNTYNHWLLIKFLKLLIEVTSLIELGRFEFHQTLTLVKGRATPD